MLLNILDFVFNQGFTKMQGMTEGHIGALMGASAVIGIIGTFLYPIMRRRLTLARTGIFGFSAEILCLVPCVISVFMWDSPFDLSFGFFPFQSLDTHNCTRGMLYYRFDVVDLIHFK